MTIERYRRAGLDRVDETPSIDIRYDAEASDRSWSSLPTAVHLEATQQLAAHGMWLSRAWADVAWPELVRRRNAGSVYRQRLGWCATADGLMLLDARQPGQLRANRFHPDGQWRVRMMFRTPEQAQLKHRVQQARAGGGTADRTTARPVAGYSGDHPEIWTTLPSVVCAGIQHFVTDERMHQELAEAQVTWRDGIVTEDVWYERRGGQLAAGVALRRTATTSRRLRTWGDAVAVVRALPWTVTAWRCDLTSAHALASRAASRLLPDTGR